MASLPEFVVSIYCEETGEHIIESYHAETGVQAAYITLINNFDVDLEANDDRPDFDPSEMEEEFKNYGYSVIVFSL